MVCRYLGGPFSSGSNELLKNARAVQVGGLMWTEDRKTAEFRNLVDLLGPEN